MSRLGRTPTRVVAMPRGDNRHGPGGLAATGHDTGAMSRCPPASDVVTAQMSLWRNTVVGERRSTPWPWIPIMIVDTGLIVGFPARRADSEEAWRRSRGGGRRRRGGDLCMLTGIRGD